jgi:hypothetical protein
VNTNFESNSRRNQPQVEAVHSLVKAQLDYMMSALIWVPDLYVAAKDKLLPEYFDRPGEAQYAVYLRAINKLAEENGGRIPLDGTANIVYLAVVALAENEVKESAPGVYADLMTQGNVLHLCTNHYNKANINRMEAFKLLQMFLNDRRIARRINTLAVQGHTSDMLTKINELFHDASRVQAMGESDIVSAVHVRSSRPGLQLQPTGIKYFDERLNGGVGAGKVYGLLGPTGVGKTLNFVSLMVSTAIQEQIRHRRMVDNFGPGSSKLGNYYYFIYEGEKEDIVRRCLAYLAYIPLDRLSRYEFDPTMELAGPNDPRPDYEARLFPEGVGPEGEPMLSEIERYGNANAILSQNIFIRSMVPSPENPKRGCGYVSEIQSVLIAEQEAGREVAGYYIDYAKIAAKNYCGSKVDNLRHFIGGMPMECVKYINSYLPRAHCWIANQFNTEANRRSPTWVPHHSFSSEAGDFGDNCWFTFCLGTKSQEDNCCLINCSKQRDCQSIPPSTLYIHGGINRMVCMDSLIDLDSTTGQFVHKGAFERDHRGTLVVPFRRNPVAG